MALVQAPPVSAERHTPGLTPPSSPSSLHAMGSVSSLVSGRTAHQELRHQPKGDLGAGLHRPTGSNGPQEPPRNSSPPSLRQTPTACYQGPENGGDREKYCYLNEDVNEDWKENHVSRGSPGSDYEEAKEGHPLNGTLGGPPPKLVPVSGKLEKNMEKTMIRPTAFKPVVPKNRNSVQYLTRRLGGALPDNQSNLNLLLPVQRGASPTFSEKRSSYSGGRNAGSQSCSMSDSGRNSLSSLPTYSSAGYSLASSEATGSHLEPGRTAAGHRPSNSDSGRSSSSKSTGSLSGRGHPLSDSGSSGRSPVPVDGYEGVVRDLEEKLRERDLELQQVRDNLDENEAAICQVYEEKQKRCELELEELRQTCASRMHQSSQKAQRAQQVLQLQVYQLQQEKKKLQEDYSQLLQERDHLEERCTSYEHDQTQLGPRLEETKWEVCQKTGEISLLKQQLKDLQGELSQRVGEIVSLRGQLREARGQLEDGDALLHEANEAQRTRTMELEVCENELQRRKSEAELLREKVGWLEEESARLQEALCDNTGPAHVRQSLDTPRARGSAFGSAYRDGEQPAALGSDEAKGARPSAEAFQGLRQQTERMRAELASECRRGQEQAVAFDGERRAWQEEKDKVIRYQKQLQQNYVQMYRRNRELEHVLRELSLELESQELDEGSGNEINFDDVTATEI